MRRRIRIPLVALIVAGAAVVAILAPFGLPAAWHPVFTVLLAIAAVTVIIIGGRWAYEKGRCDYRRDALAHLDRSQRTPGD